MTDLVFLDTETTGLDPSRHSVWEIAYAVNDGPIESSIVRHSLVNADPFALSINGYLDRNSWADGAEAYSLLGVTFEGALIKALKGATLVAANPAFDAGFLAARWGSAPWHYRMLDVEAYAMPVLGHDRPKGLFTIASDLRDLGHDIPAPDHTAAADVATLRASFNALTELAKERLQ